MSRTDGYLNVAEEDVPLEKQHEGKTKFRRPSNTIPLCPECAGWFILPALLRVHSLGFHRHLKRTTHES